MEGISTFVSALARVEVHRRMKRNMTTTPIVQPRTVKPWGRELIFAHTASMWEGPVIEKGHSLSRQYHEVKDEPFTSRREP